MGNYNPDLTLDLKGLSCPLPVIKISQKVKELEQGVIIEALTTDPGAKEDIPAWCESTGNELLEVEEEGGIFKFYIRVKK